MRWLILLLFWVGCTGAEGGTNVGDSCMGANACGEGRFPACIRAWPGGYCTDIDCGVGSCPSGSTCVTGVSFPMWSLMRSAWPSATRSTTVATTTAASRGRRARRSAPLAILSLGLSAFLFACDGPCESLADRICSCEPNNTEERGCLEQVKSTMALPGSAPTTAELERCEVLLDTCDCEALEREDYQACGLTK